ncbi:MAG: pyridoxal 5'-phosphate synthase glutaminase subunit PdxT [Gammaproteobacteria bacterium]
METVGVLALQGGYQRHADCLAQLGVPWRLISCAEDLDGCRALILPGGESTCMTRLIEARALLPALHDFAQAHPVMGTCAGLILMARSDDPRVAALGLLDVVVARNAYGRQAQSFTVPLALGPGQGGEVFPGVFIRAPQILRTGPRVEVLACHAGRPVLVAQGPHLGMCFHPELTSDPRIYVEWLRRTAEGLRRTRPSADTAGQRRQTA